MSAAKAGKNFYVLTDIYLINCYLQENPLGKNTYKIQKNICWVPTPAPPLFLQMYLPHSTHFCWRAIFTNKRDINITSKKEKILRCGSKYSISPPYSFLTK
jgi:hypothetical protein